MTYTLPSATDAIWDIALWMTQSTKESELTRSFTMPGISMHQQDAMRDAFATKVLESHAQNTHLQMLLDRRCTSADEHHAVIRETIDLLGRAYSGCSSVYPKEWFLKFRQRVRDREDSTLHSAELTFLPPVLSSKQREAVA